MELKKKLLNKNGYLYASVTPDEVIKYNLKKGDFVTLRKIEITDTDSPTADADDLDTYNE